MPLSLVSGFVLLGAENFLLGPGFLGLDSGVRPEVRSTGDNSGGGGARYPGPFIGQDTTRVRLSPSTRHVLYFPISTRRYPKSTTMDLFPKRQLNMNLILRFIPTWPKALPLIIDHCRSADCFLRNRHVPSLRSLDISSNSPPLNIYQLCCHRF